MPNRDLAVREDPREGEEPIVFRVYWEAASGLLQTMGLVSGKEDPPKEWEYRDYDFVIDLSIYMWDETIRDFVYRPPKVLKDRLQDLVDDPAFAEDYGKLYANMSQEDRDLLNVVLDRLLGRQRYRNESEPVSLE